MERARKRTSEANAAVSDRIDNRLMNATDGDAPMALGSQGFDAAVAIMAIRRPSGRVDFRPLPWFENPSARNGELSN